VLLLQIYLAILTVRVLLSWFRNIDWFSEPWNTLRQVGSHGCAGRAHQVGILRQLQQRIAIRVAVELRAGCTAPTGKQVQCPVRDSPLAAPANLSIFPAAAV
jgi:hypothetical protein